MGYQQNNNKKFNNNRNGGFKKNNNHSNNDRPKNKTITFPLVMNGTTANGNTYDVNGALANLETLKDNGTFGMLSVPVHISRALLENDNTRRGSMNIGFVKDVSIPDLTVDVTVYGSSVAAIENKSLIFVPRMLVKNEQVITFLGFDLSADTAE